MARFGSLILALCISTSTACGDDPYRGGPCSDFTPFETALVPVSAVSRVIPLGELDPPEDVVPSVGGGFGFNQATAQVVAPGSVVITAIESSEYLVSPGRQGVTDFGLVMYACDDIKMELQHIVTLDDGLSAKLGKGHCEVHEGAEETTKDCRFDVAIRLEAGDPIGVTGTYQNDVPTGLDMAAVDLAYDIPWLNPDRIGNIESRRHGICPYTLFAPTIANAYLDKATSGPTPVTRTEDRCGVPNIGVADTPQGIWVRQDNPVTLEEDAPNDTPNFLTLSPGVVDPDVAQLVSSGVAALGTDLVTTAKEATGRVNLDFTLVPNDGTIHCYEGLTPSSDTVSHLIALSAEDVLTVEKQQTPCSIDDPSTWAFTEAAIAFIR